MQATVPTTLVEDLKKIVGEDYVKSDIFNLAVYGSDSSVHEALPQAVVRPKSVEDVSAVMRYANDNKIPVVPRGSGTGMSGQAVPIDGGIILDLKEMNRILEIRPQDTLCKVEGGVIDDDLNRALKPYGFFYPPAPASSRMATIAGEIANNASGLRSVKYGATRDAVLGMKVVMADGKVVNLGANTRVEASGYQLDRLMVGSEGTLGVIVEATLKIVPLPKFRCMAIASFNKLEEAGDAISDIMASGCQPSVLELMDNVAITAVNKTLNMGLPDVDAVLFFEADGNNKESIDIELERIKEICEQHNAFGIKMSYDIKERTKLFSGRKKLFAALSRYEEGLSCTSLADDMAVPYSKMAVLANKIHEIADRHNVVMTAYGHCGSGCMHTKILMDPKTEQQWDDANKAVAEVYQFVREAGGTTSAEHGIGLSKAPDWKKEKEESLELMRAIKAALDPNNILNPHKMQDAPDCWVTATKLRYPHGAFKECFIVEEDT
jgi:glycolate oxidase